MQTFELILFLLAAVIASSILEKFLPRVSLPLVQVALGVGIALAVTTPLEWGIDTELLLILFIAPLHFNESRHVDSGALWNNRWGIASLSVGLVFAIAFGCGLALHALVPAIPLAAAVALGAAMGSTDAVAVTALTHDRRFGRRHEALLKGEALFNDVTGTVVFQCCMNIIAVGAFSVMHAGEEFALDLFGGLFGGFIMGALAWGLLELIRRAGLDNPTLHVMLELLLPFVIYLAAKSLHIGAVIAVVASGLMMSLLPQRHSAEAARTKLQAKSVWETIEFVLNGIIFVILGMQLPRLLRPAADGALSDPWGLLAIVVVLTLVLEAVRFLWILGMDLHAAAREGRSLTSCLDRAHLKSTLAMAFAGAKGGITLSLMLTMGAAVPDRAELISVASGVIVLTLLLANFAVPALVPSKRSARRTRELVDAEIDLVCQVIASIEADAHFTGAVRSAAGTADGASGAESACASQAPGEVGTTVAEARHAEGEGAEIEAGAEAEAAVPAAGQSVIDEPATAIVMKRYADLLQDLAPAASAPAARRARAEAARVDALFDQLDQVARDAVLWDGEEDDGDGEGADGSVVALAGEGPRSISAHFRAMRATHDAIENVQEQALVRELQLIKELVAEGKISASHAKELRNTVYIQQLVLD
ncbi:sodium:proton antiporter [Adlercreutzia equolifaciens]|uniref:cation:proton antiporter n=1 Tax=Adlercreutzia equolifaciens TaxID=446660 RepID=UPI0023B09B2A|nr:sodium:proton antiporter [Adlercreutzia equolifaciens]MDE8702954.1 sodium:proton antiporter [Adlercreutzia equolifaciens]